MWNFFYHNCSLLIHSVSALGSCRILNQFTNSGGVVENQNTDQKQPKILFKMLICCTTEILFFVKIICGESSDTHLELNLFSPRQL